MFELRLCNCLRVVRQCVINLANSHKAEVIVKGGENFQSTVFHQIHYWDVCV